MSLGRSDCAVISLPGSILVVGGSNGRTITDTTDALSLQTMSFAVGPTMLAARSGCAALALSQDHSPRRALVVSGRDSDRFYYPSLTTTEVLIAAT